MCETEKDGGRWIPARAWWREVFVAINEVEWWSELFASYLEGGDANSVVGIEVVSLLTFSHYEHCMVVV